MSDPINNTSATTTSATQSGQHTANISIVYLLVMLGFFSWLLFDTWIDAHSILTWAGYNIDHLNTPTFHLMAYILIGGALGSIVNGIRSVLRYYERFNSHYIWKYLTAPWTGALLALLVYALIRSTVAVLGGQLSNEAINTPQLLANFAASALAGYGAKDVFIWLDAQVHQLFKVTETAPDVQGQPQDIAESRVQAKNLAVGAISNIPQDDPSLNGTVVGQAPEPGTPIDRGQTVDLTIATPGADTNGAAPLAPMRIKERNDHGTLTNS